MAYTKQTWADGSAGNTPLSAARLNVMEEGIRAAAATADAAKPGTYTPTKADVGLGNVDNTSDANKPVSTAQQTALNAKVTGVGITRIEAVAEGAAGTAAGVLYVELPA